MKDDRDKRAEGASNDAPFDAHAAVKLNRARLEQRFASAAGGGARWLVECRDLGDAFDRDAGIYFIECADDAAVDHAVAEQWDENPWNRLLGIFDLGKPLDGQPGGLSCERWLSGER